MNIKDKAVQKETFYFFTSISNYTGESTRFRLALHPKSL